MRPNMQCKKEREHNSLCRSVQSVPKVFELLFMSCFITLSTMHVFKMKQSYIYGDFTGFGSSGMDYGMMGGKETGTESRFKQWTSMMDGLPSVASQDANMHKNGERFHSIYPQISYKRVSVMSPLPVKCLLSCSCKLLSKIRGNTSLTLAAYA